MDYAKLQLVHTRAATWRLAGAAARGAAVSVLAYSADQEHGGCIPEAHAWDDATWRAAIGLPLVDVEAAIASRLCVWEEDGSLRCILYDHVGGAALDVRRAQGHHGAKGARYGILGAEYGKLGGRPPKKEKGRVSKGGRGGVLDDHDTPPRPPSNPAPVQSSPVQTSPDQASSSGGAAAPAAAAGDEAVHEQAGDEPSETERWLAYVESLGGWLVDHGTGELLHEPWLKELSQPTTDGGTLSSDQVAEVFTQARRLTGHDVRYPSGFAKALEALRVERRAAKRHEDHVAAQRTQDERRTAQLAKVEADRRRSAYQVEQLDAHLASADGAEISSAIAANPTAAKWLESARKHARTGHGANLSLLQLARIFPDLDRFKHLDAPADEGSAA